MNETAFWSIVATGFVIAGRGQRWSKQITLLVVALCGSGHVLFTTVLGILVVWLGIETSKWTGGIFPWIAGGALILFGLYYLVRQARGGGHGHLHFGPGGSHDHGSHDHGGHAHRFSSHAHAMHVKRIDIGHSTLLLEVFKDGVLPKFRVKAEGYKTILPYPEALSLETIRPVRTRQSFSFVAQDGYLESREVLQEPHEFKVVLTLSHGGHKHRQEIFFKEHTHVTAQQAVTKAADIDGRATKTAKSDRAVILGLFTLLFRPRQKVFAADRLAISDTAPRINTALLSMTTQ